MSNRIAYKNFSRAEKFFFIGLQVWILLQLSRFVAIPLISDVNTGAESAPWLFPAYLDIVAAVFGIPLMIALVYRRGLYTWTFAIIYLPISTSDTLIPTCRATRICHPLNAIYERKMSKECVSPAL